MKCNAKFFCAVFEDASDKMLSLQGPEGQNGRPGVDGTQVSTHYCSCDDCSFIWRTPLTSGYRTMSQC